jgi:hypothetical protein
MVLVCAGGAVSVLGYLGKSAPEAIVREPQTQVEIAVRPVVEALRGRVEVAGPRQAYQDVRDYDPVLAAHCRL